MLMNKNAYIDYEKHLFEYVEKEGRTGDKDALISLLRAFGNVSAAMLQSVAVAKKLSLEQTDDLVNGWAYDVLRRVNELSNTKHRRRQ